MTMVAISSETTFTTVDHFEIFEQTWSRQDPKGVIVITHGIAEHSSRYAHVAQTLVEAGYEVIGFDLRGHGKSSGKRNYVNTFRDYLVDLQTVIDRAECNYPALPLFLFGHSMGGEIVSLYLIEGKTTARGALLSAPSVKVSEDLSPFIQKISGLLSVLLPKLPAVKLSSTHISKDPAVVKSYDEDPLNYRKGILARTGSEVLVTTKTIMENAHKIDLPVLIMHGGEDKLADVSGSEMLYESIHSEDKALKIYAGLYHEIFNEPEQDMVKQDMIDWLNTHI